MLYNCPIKKIFIVSKMNWLRYCLYESVIGNCSCYDYLDDEGYGKCKKRHPDTNNLAACYVNQPTNCSDAKYIPGQPGRQISSYACK